MSTLLRNALKKITPIRKTVGFFRKITYPKYRKLYDGLSEELCVAKAENAALQNEVVQLRRSVELLEKNVSDFAANQDRVSLSFKRNLDMFNLATNRLLYDKELDSIPADESFNPKVSVIVPVFNGQKYVKTAIECALAQTYKNIEIIAVNDGSTDNTDQILRAYGERITYLKKENGGVSSALNAGIAAMTGDYFAWLSHDDMIESDHIERLVQYLRHHKGEKVIPFAAFKFIDENGELLTEATLNARLNMFDYKTSVTDKYAPLLFGEINGGSVLIPKEAFKKYGMFDENRRITQERDMWSRLIGEYRFVCIPYDTAMIRIHGEQVSNNREAVAEESGEKNLEIIEEIYGELNKENPQKARELYQYLILHYYCNSVDSMCEKLKQKSAEIKRGNKEQDE